MKRVLIGNIVFCSLFILINLNFALAEGKYDDLLNNPKISGAMIWENASGTKAYPDWPDHRKEQLRHMLDDLESGAAFPLTAPPTLIDDSHFGETDAWMIYLTHVAHSLWLEANHFVAWRITDFSEYELRLLLDGRYLFIFTSSHNTYAVNRMEGIGCVTDWNVAFSYRFMRVHHFIGADQRSTVMAFASWCRHYIRHISGRPDADNFEAIYGYRGLPRVDRILAPLPETNGHISAGCWGTTGLFNAVMRSVNIPVAHGHSLFAVPGGSPQVHSRIELPTLGLGLGHSDDLYTSTFAISGTVVPIDSVFRTRVWLKQNIDHPMKLDAEGLEQNTVYEQAFFNEMKFELSLAVRYLDDWVLYQRALDGMESTTPSRLASKLTGVAVGGRIIYFAKPFFDDHYVKKIIGQVDQRLREIGDGNWSAGAEIIISRYTTPPGKDDWLTSVTINKEAPPLKMTLFQNYPNPFNPTTTIAFDVPRATNVELTVFDMLGRQVAVLVNKRYEAGRYKATFDASQFASGIYFYRIRMGDFEQTHKMLLVR